MHSHHLVCIKSPFNFQRESLSASQMKGPVFHQRKLCGGKDQHRAEHLPSGHTPAWAMISPVITLTCFPSTHKNLSLFYNYRLSGATCSCNIWIKTTSS